MRSGRPSGPDRLKGTLKPWRLETIFGAVVVRGILVHGNDARRFVGEVRCFDGDAAGLSMLWTSEGRVRIEPRCRRNALGINS